MLHVSKEQAQGGSDSHLRDPKTGRELEVVDKVRACVRGYELWGWVYVCVCGCGLGCVLRTGRWAGLLLAHALIKHMHMHTHACAQTDLAGGVVRGQLHQVRDDAGVRDEPLAGGEPVLQGLRRRGRAAAVEGERGRAGTAIGLWLFLGSVGSID